MFVLVALDSIPAIASHPNHGTIVDMFARKIPENNFNTIEAELQAVEEQLQISSALSPVLKDQVRTAELVRSRFSKKKNQIPLGVKALLVDSKGEFLAPSSKEYWLSSPKETLEMNFLIEMSGFKILRRS